MVSSFEDSLVAPLSTFGHLRSLNGSRSRRKPCVRSHCLSGRSVCRWSLPACVVCRLRSQQCEVPCTGAVSSQTVPTRRGNCSRTWTLFGTLPIGDPRLACQFSAHTGPAWGLHYTLGSSMCAVRPSGHEPQLSSVVEFR